MNRGERSLYKLELLKTEVESKAKLIYLGSAMSSARGTGQGQGQEVLLETANTTSDQISEAVLPDAITGGLSLSMKGFTKPDTLPNLPPKRIRPKFFRSLTPRSLSSNGRQDNVLDIYKL